MEDEIMDNEATATEAQVQDQPTKKKSGRHLTPAEQLERIAAQQKELAARARAIRAREDAKERKARAHRLIQVGAIAEAVFGAPIAGADMLARFESFLRSRHGELADALKG